MCFLDYNPNETKTFLSYFPAPSIPLSRRLWEEVPLDYGEGWLSVCNVKWTSLRMQSLQREGETWDGTETPVLGSCMGGSPQPRPCSLLDICEVPLQGLDAVPAGLKGHPKRGLTQEPVLDRRWVPCQYPEYS